jgi:hypothetical protein
MPYWRRRRRCPRSDSTGTSARHGWSIATEIDGRPAMRRRRRRTSSDAAGRTDPVDHPHSGGSDRCQSPGGSTGSTSHRIGASPGISWWVRPAGVATLAVARGRHRRAEEPRRGGRAGRLRSWLDTTGTLQRDRPCPAIARREWSLPATAMPPGSGSRRGARPWSRRSAGAVLTSGRPHGHSYALQLADM